MACLSDHDDSALFDAINIVNAKPNSNFGKKTICCHEKSTNNNDYTSFAHLSETVSTEGNTRRTDGEATWPVPLSDDILEQHIISTLPSNQVEIFDHVNRTKNILIRVITWNQEARPHPSSEDLRKYLIPLDRYHIIAIGTQECENSIAVSLLNPSKAKWEESVTEAVGGNYCKVCDRILQATYLIIFAHKAIMPLVTNVKSSAIPTGFRNTLGNKGGIGIAFDIGMSSVCFITAHLSAHQYAVSRRTLEFQKISLEVGKSLGKNVINNVTKKEDMCNTKYFPHLEKQFDFVFWSGDMNYRIHSSLENVEELLQLNRHRELRQMDQLEHVKMCTPFIGFLEGPLNFRPTYKLISNSDLYDTSHLKRIPSWTDRILYKGNSDIKLLCYCSAPKIRTSDHRPVYAVFSVKISFPDPSCSKPTKEAASRACTIS